MEDVRLQREKDGQLGMARLERGVDGGGEAHEGGPFRGRQTVEHVRLDRVGEITRRERRDHPLAVIGQRGDHVGMVEGPVAPGGSQRLVARRAPMWSDPIPLESNRCHRQVDDVTRRNRPRLPIEVGRIFGIVRRALQCLLPRHTVVEMQHVHVRVTRDDGQRIG